MERIDNALFSMEDPGTMQSILIETGAYHRRIVGFSQEMFNVGKKSNKIHFWKSFFHQFSEEPLLKALKNTLDERYTPQMEEIYRVIVQFIVQTMQEGYTGGL